MFLKTRNLVSIAAGFPKTTWTFQLFLILLSLFACSYSIYGKLFDVNEATAQTADVLYKFCNVSTIVYVTITNVVGVTTIGRNIGFLDVGVVRLRRLSAERVSSDLRKIGGLPIILLLVLVALAFVVHTTIALTAASRSRYHMWEAGTYYGHNFILLCALYFIENLRSIVENTSRATWHRLMGAGRKRAQLIVLLTIDERHREMCHALDQFGKKFTVFALSVNVSIVASIVVDVTLILVNAIKLQKTFSEYFVYALNLTLNLVQCFLFTRAGERIENEGFRMNESCLKVANRIDDAFTPAQATIVVKQLRLLFERNNGRNVRLKVGQFYVLNFGCLTFLVGIVVMYVIVANQYLFGHS